MGKLNKRALLGHLQRLGAASRADLAKSLGLSQPTAGKIVDELLAGGVFEEIDLGVGANDGSKRRAKVGRPARMIRLNQSKARFLGIHLGIRETSLALLSVGSDGEDRWDTRFKTPDSAAAWQKRLRKAAAAFSQKNFWGVLFSVPGIVDERGGRILFSPNIHWTENIDLSALVRKVWRAPVLLIQEEHAVAMSHQTNDPGGDDFLLADFGEGVGGAVVVGGKLFEHPMPISGELGHTPVAGNSRPCGCGAIGCLETLASMRGLLQSFAEANPRAPRSWPALVSAIETHGVQPWLAHALDATAGVIAGALNVLGLRRIVITGILPELPTVVMQYLMQSIARGSLWAKFGSINVEGAQRRRNAGLVTIGLDHLIMPVNENAETGAAQSNFARAKNL